MRALPPFIVCLALALLLGCARTKPAFDPPPGMPGPTPGAEAPTQKSAKPDHSVPSPTLIVTPETALTGKVVLVNAAARFVVLNFPIGRLPALGQTLGVYRQGLKVGEVKTSGPQRDDNIVADVLTGEAAVGDEVRDR